VNTFIKGASIHPTRL